MLFRSTQSRPGLLPNVSAFLLAFVVAAVPYVGVGAIFRGPVYARFDDVNTAFEAAFWAFYATQLIASLAAAILVARALRLRLLPAVLGAVSFLVVVAWPTFFVYSVATSCELGSSYPLPGVEACR
jgi:hypothetical protein